MSAPTPCSPTCGAISPRLQLSGEERSAAEKQRDYIATKLKPAQLSKAQQLARDWKLEEIVSSASRADS